MYVDSKLTKQCVFKDLVIQSSYFPMVEAIFLPPPIIVYSIDYGLVSGIALETRNAKMNKTRIYLQRT